MSVDEIPARPATDMDGTLEAVGKPPQFVPAEEQPHPAWPSAARPADRLLVRRPGPGIPGGQLTRRGDVCVAGQRAVELAAGADVEFGEDLAQVVLDRARADEQPGADLWV